MTIKVDIGDIFQLLISLSCNSNEKERNIMIDTKTFIQLAAIVVFVASFAILFLKREDAILLSCLFDIIGWLMLIYCKL